MVSLREIVRNRNVEFVEERKIYVDGNGMREDVFSGAFRVDDNTIIPLDSDTYSFDETYDGYVWWSDGSGMDFNGENINLTVYKVIHTN